MDRVIAFKKVLLFFKPVVIPAAAATVFLTVCILLTWCLKPSWFDDPESRLK